MQPSRNEAVYAGIPRMPEQSGDTAVRARLFGAWRFAGTVPA